MLRRISLSLPFALALSLALHGSLLLPEVRRRPPAAPLPAALQAVLRLPPVAEAAPAEALLKNTLDTEDAPEAVKTLTRPPVPEKPSAKLRPNIKREVQVAQKKISKNVFYPSEAIARGIEGEVRLIITLTDDGRIADVNIAASSGHPILDNAAIKAAYATGKLSGATSRELILPVIFRLQ
jgi:protein TonB